MWLPNSFLVLAISTPPFSLLVYKKGRMDNQKFFQMATLYLTKKGKTFGGQANKKGKHLRILYANAKQTTSDKSFLVAPLRTEVTEV